MSEASLAVALWERVGTGLDAVHKFAKLVQVLATSWEVLRKFLNHSQRKKVKVTNFRQDLLVIARELREAHFAIGQQNLLPPDDFLAQELAVVLMAVEKACAADPRLYELEVVLERAEFVQERVAERLLAVMPPGPNQCEGPPPKIARVETANLNSSRLQQALADLSARSRMLSQALHTSMGGGLNDEGTSLQRQWSGCSDFSLESEDYDTASELETDSCAESCAEEEGDDGYTTCDEDAFWNEARYNLGVPLGRACANHVLDQALLRLGEEPEWQKLEGGLWRFVSHSYSTVIDRQPDGEIRVRGAQADLLLEDLCNAIDGLEATSTCRSQ